MQSSAVPIILPHPKKLAVLPSHWSWSICLAVKEPEGWNGNQVCQDYYELVRQMLVVNDATQSQIILSLGLLGMLMGCRMTLLVWESIGFHWFRIWMARLYCMIKYFSSVKIPVMLVKHFKVKLVHTGREKWCTSITNNSKWTTCLVCHKVWLVCEFLYFWSSIDFY